MGRTISVSRYRTVWITFQRKCYLWIYSTTLAVYYFESKIGNTTITDTFVESNSTYI